MPQASVKRLIQIEKKNLIDLVLDIDKYPNFIPYCINSKVYERNDKGENIHIIDADTADTVIPRRNADDMNALTCI